MFLKTMLMSVGFTLSKDFGISIFSVTLFRQACMYFYFFYLCVGAENMALHFIH